MRKSGATRTGVLVLALVLGGCAPSDDGVGDGRTDMRDGEAGECTDGDARCSGNVAQLCVGGRWRAGVDCAESGDVCEPGLGCVSCRPGHTFCRGNDVRQCGPDGEASTVVSTCDPAEGETCDPVSGVCISLCARAAADRSNIGCDYWAVDLDNAENSVDWAAAAQFAVVVANLSNTYQSEVVIEVDDGPPGTTVHSIREVTRATLDPGDLEVFHLDRWDVDGDNAEGIDDDPQTTLSRRVYHIRSTTPVVAYQFNPIDQAFSNAASVLLPTTALDNEYYGVVWPPANPMVIPGLLPYPNRDYVTIVAVEDHTTVRVRPTYAIMEGVGDPWVRPIDAGEEAEFVLHRYDVLNLETVAMARMADPVPDLTGTTVRSDRPVVVFMGVDLASVGDKMLPNGSTEACCAEHMEAQVPPTSSMGTNFVVSRSPSRTQPGSGWLEYDYYRVFAVRDGTHVTTTSGEPGVADFTLDEGEFLEFSTREGFTLQSDPYPVHVVQYLTARDQVYHLRPSAGGDPDMVYIPPVEQRRNTYIFTTGVGFSENWAVISMPEGASATIDGDDVAATCGTPLEDGLLDGVRYRAYYCQIGEGRHDVAATGDQPVGVMVFGYYNVGSYQYPAGSEMRRIFFG